MFSFLLMIFSMFFIFCFIIVAPWLFFAVFILPGLLVIVFTIWYRHKHGITGFGKNLRQTK